ncbi:hypothetical protein ABID53_004354 [Bacillus oleivorans]
MMSKNHKSKLSGDDPSHNRLLSFFQANLDEPIKKIHRVRDHIYKIETDLTMYVGKGFSNKASFKKQKWLTKRLQKAGFKKTYQFLKTDMNKGYHYKGKYYGILTWIEHGHPVFRFNSIENCEAGIILLNEFHDHTKKVLAEGNPHFATTNYYQKWVDRFQQFKRNIHIVETLVPSPVIDDILKWGRESLKMIEHRSPQEKNELVILHGDVAHHNFIRTENNDLFLIDFDLSSAGNPIHDYLQYANRILPFLHWDLNHLTNLPVISQYLRDPYFLKALMYPTDIYREWNRAIKQRLLGQEKWIHNLLNATIEQFEQRSNFFDSLQNMVK